MFDYTLVNFKTKGKLRDIVAYEEWKENLSEEEFKKEQIGIRKKLDKETRQKLPLKRIQEQLEFDYQKLLNDKEFVEELKKKNVTIKLERFEISVIQNQTVIGKVRNIGLFSLYSAEHYVFGIDGSCLSLKQGIERLLNPTDEDREMYKSRAFLDREDIMSSAEACRKWGISTSTLRMNVEKFPQGTIRKFGKQWVVTEEGMKAVFGEPNKN